MTRKPAIERDDNDMVTIEIAYTAQRLARHVDRACKKCTGPIRRKPNGKTYCPACIRAWYMARKSVTPVCQCGAEKTQCELQSGRLVWRCVPCWTASYKYRSLMACMNAMSDSQLAERIARAKDYRQ